MTVTGTCFASGQQLVCRARRSARAAGRDRRRGHGHRAGEHGRRVHDDGRRARDHRARPAPRDRHRARPGEPGEHRDDAGQGRAARVRLEPAGRRAARRGHDVAVRGVRRRASRSTRTSCSAAGCARPPLRGRAGRLRHAHARARARIPGVRALEPGRWTIRLDQRMTYREGTPGSVARFNIVRRR